jgi:hypothetical protein
MVVMNVPPSREPVDREWVAAQVAANTAAYRGYRQRNADNPFKLVDPKTDAYRFDGEIPSSNFKRNGVTYHVTVEPNGPSTCTCPGFTTYHRGQDCSHITAVKETLRNG